jgi:ankyrin repeat protein
MLSSAPVIVNCLLHKGADIRSTADEGSTALEQACGRGDSGVVKVLLKRGVAEQLLKASKSGHTPLNAAVNNCHDEVALLLLRCSSLASTSITRGLQRTNLCCAVLLQAAF